jgi:hypothetical protein
MEDPRANLSEEKRAILDRILAVWVRNPDMRLGQIISGGLAMGDAYYIEDKDLIKKIESMRGHEPRMTSTSPRAASTEA